MMWPSFNRHLEQVRALLMYPIRKREAREKQKREGYIVEIPTGSRGEYVVYREGERSLSAFIDVSLATGVRLYTETIRKWETPVKGEVLSHSKYELVLNRIRDYLSLEGPVTLDDSSLITSEEQLASMKAIGEREGWTTVTEDGRIKFVKKSPER